MVKGTGITQLLLLIIGTVWWPMQSLSADRLLIESSIEPKKPYIQQQVHYTLKLYRDSHLQRGYFVKPTISDAILKHIDSPPPREVTYQGRQYELVEQRYLLFPQRSGKIQLPAPVFSSRDLFIEGKPITLDVKGKPSTADINNWIVASDLRITEQWIAPDAPWHVGDHLERIITIQADQVTGAQIPSINIPPIEGMQVQRVDSEINELVNGSLLTGERTETILYIPERAGTFSIKPITMAWWNSHNQQMEKNILQGRKLKISATKPPKQAPTSNFKQRATTPSIEAESNRTFSLTIDMVIWPLLLISLFLLVLWSGIIHSVNNMLKLAVRLIQLRTACRKQHLSQIRQIFSEWSEESRITAAPFSLTKLANRVSDRATKTSLLQLDHALYANTATEWDPRSAEKEFVRLLLQTRENRKLASRNTLPPLWQ